MNKTEKVWDMQSNAYDKNENKYKQTYKKILTNTKKYLDVSDIVLDYACGTGIITNQIADNVREIQAIDISSKMIEVAKRNAEKRKIDNVQYIQSTIGDAVLYPASFNIVLAFNILHLLNDSQQAIQRISNLLKPGGLFISATACMGEKTSLLGILLFLLSKIGIVPYVRDLKFSELENLIAGNNFQIIETEDLQQSPPNYFIVAKKI